MSKTNVRKGSRVFRTSIGGYNKTDVNNYIIGLNAEYEQREAALRERAERAEKNARCDADTERIASLEGHIAELEAALAEKNVISCPADYEALREKAKLYDEEYAKINDAVINAKRTAEDIVSGARNDAFAIREKAEREAEERRKSLDSAIEKALGSIFGRLKAAAEKSCDDLVNNSNSIEDRLRRAMLDIRVESATASEKIAWNESNLRAEIEAELSRLTKKSDESNI